MASASVKLRVVDSAVAELVGRELELSGAAIVAGRAEECDFHLADNSMSRRHATIQWTARGIEVRDSGSANGVFVDDRRVPEAVLGAGQRFLVGQTTIEVVVEYPPAAPAPRPAVEPAPDRTMRMEIAPQIAAAPTVEPARAA